MFVFKTPCCIKHVFYSQNYTGVITSPVLPLQFNLTKMFYENTPAISSNVNTPMHRPNLNSKSLIQCEKSTKSNTV